MQLPKAASRGQRHDRPQQWQTAAVNDVLRALQKNGSGSGGGSGSMDSGSGSGGTSSSRSRSSSNSAGLAQAHAETIRSQNEPDVQRELATFDASKATCFKVEDRERLLGIIESAFGDFNSFNGKVRTIFRKRGTTTKLRAAEHKYEAPADE